MQQQLQLQVACYIMSSCSWSTPPGAELTAPLVPSTGKIPPLGCVLNQATPANPARPPPLHSASELQSPPTGLGQLLEAAEGRLRASQAGTTQIDSLLLLPKAAGGGSSAKISPKPVQPYSRLMPGVCETSVAMRVRVSVDAYECDCE